MKHFPSRPLDPYLRICLLFKAAKIVLSSIERQLCAILNRTRVFEIQFLATFPKAEI